MAYLLDMYPDAIALADSDGCLPIHHACFIAQLETTVQLLLDRHQGTHHGLDVTDNDGNIPILSLLASCGHHQKRIHRLLLETYPESARIRNRNGSLPLHLVCSNAERPFSAHFVRYLVDIDILTVLEKDGNGRTPLELASAAATRDETASG